MKRPTVWFVDTSVFVNLLSVPGRDQDRGRVVREQKERLSARCELVLPVATVIETGNHIAQVSNGSGRRKAAERFSAVLRLVAADEAPWHLHSVRWDGQYLERLVAGGLTGLSLVEHAVSHLGCGDLSILVEREIYRAEARISDVRIWTLDDGLNAYN
jgi:hypothetical protein